MHQPSIRSTCISQVSWSTCTSQVSGKLATTAFDVESMTCGYDKCMHIRESLSTGESLVWEQEIGNSHDNHAVAIKKDINGKITIVLTI